MRVSPQRGFASVRLSLLVVAVGSGAVFFLRPPHGVLSGLILVWLWALLFGSSFYLFYQEKSRQSKVVRPEPEWQQCDLLKARSLMTLEIMINESKEGRNYIEFDRRPPVDEADAAWRAFELMPSPATARVLIKHSPSSEDVFRFCVASKNPEEGETTAVVRRRVGSVR
jgi:hypothetical protein